LEELALFVQHEAVSRDDVKELDYLSTTVTDLSDYYSYTCKLLSSIPMRQCCWCHEHAGCADARGYENS
jgi:hypothetical protein